MAPRRRFVQPAAPRCPASATSLGQPAAIAPKPSQQSAGPRRGHAGGRGFLYFYYSNLSHKQAEAKAKVAQERTAKGTGEMKLPPWGRWRDRKPPQQIPPSARPRTDRARRCAWDAAPLGADGAATVSPGTAAAGSANGPPVKTAAQIARLALLEVHLFAGRGSISFECRRSSDCKISSRHWGESFFF